MYNYSIDNLSLGYEPFIEVTQPCIQGLSNTGMSIIIIANIMLFALLYLYTTKEYYKNKNKVIYLLKLGSLSMVALNLILAYYWLVL